MKKWNQKKVAVVGLGVSNIPVIRLLAKEGAVISGRDCKTQEQLGDRYDILQGMGVDCILGDDYLKGLDTYDAVFLSPGIPKILPEIEALKGKVPLLSEISLVLDTAKAPIYGITGSSGKTTTTTLVGEMIKKSGLQTFVGGNIGKPLIEQVQDIPQESKIVLELSSFQLELLEKSPHGALVTNITENHLDIHQTMENYILAKKQIYLHQKPTDVAVFNWDCSISRYMAEECKSRKYYFSKNEKVANGTFLKGETITFAEASVETPIIKKSDINLLGEHNLENMLAAITLAKLAGASWTAIKKVASEFTGVTHRLEKIVRVNGVTYYNDSIATTPARTIAGVKAFSQPIILIAGGYDKGLSFRELAKVIIDQVKSLILLGETAPLIESEVESLQSSTPNKPIIHKVNNLEEAIQVSYNIGKQGDVVLLSPACASFDMYSNFEARGEHFRDLAKKLAK